jgi:hypothetical protein
MFENHGYYQRNPQKSTSSASSITASSASSSSSFTTSTDSNHTKLMNRKPNSVFSFPELNEQHISQSEQQNNKSTINQKPMHLPPQGPPPPVPTHPPPLIRSTKPILNKEKETPPSVPPRPKKDQ